MGTLQTIAAKELGAPSHAVINGPANSAAVPKPGQTGNIQRTCSVCSVREYAICAGVEDQAFEQLEDVRRNIQLTANETLFYDGDHASDVYTLTDGCIRLVKYFSDGRRQVVRFVTPGEYFGYLVSDCYAYSAEAVIPSTVCRFPRKALATLCDRYPALQSRMFKLACRELEQQREIQILLGRKSVGERLASFLLQLVDDAGEDDNAIHVLDLPMCRTDIADYLGTTPESIARTLTAFKGDHLISIPKSSRIIFDDYDGFRQQTQNDDDDW